jgi:hypothetical protein
VDQQSMCFDDTRYAGHGTRRYGYLTPGVSAFVGQSSSVRVARMERSRTVKRQVVQVVTSRTCGTMKKNSLPTPRPGSL